MSRRGVAGVAVVLAAGWVGLAVAQDRKHKHTEPCCPPTVALESKARYSYHREGLVSVVFDTFSGKTFKVHDPETLRIVDPVAGLVTIRKLEKRDELGVIRQGR